MKKKLKTKLTAILLSITTALTSLAGTAFLTTIPASAATGTKRTATRCSYCSGGYAMDCYDVNNQTHKITCTKKSSVWYEDEGRNIRPSEIGDGKCMVCYTNTATYFCKLSCTGCKFFSTIDELSENCYDTLYICSKSACYNDIKNALAGDTNAESYWYLGRKVYHKYVDSSGNYKYQNCAHGYTSGHNLSCSTHTSYSGSTHYYDNTYGYVGTSSTFYTNPITVTKVDSGIDTVVSIANATSTTETYSGNTVTLTPSSTAKSSNFKVTNSVTGETTNVTKGSSYTFTMPDQPVTLTVDYSQEEQPLDVSLSSNTISYLDDAPTLNVSGVQTSVTYNSSDTNVATIDTNGIITVNNAGTTTITVTAASNDDWLETVKTVDLTVNKGNPIIDEDSITVSEITYGNKLINSNITTNLPTYKGSNVEGNYAWQNPNDILNAGTHSCDIVFTPNDTANYNTVIFSKNVVVNKAPIEIVDSVKNSLSASAIDYEQTLADSIITGNKPQAGHWEWKLPSTQPSVSDSGTTEYGVVFIPDDTNYATAETTITLVVNKKSYSFSASDIATLNVGSLTYGQSLSESAITGTTPVSGSYQWVDGSVIPTVNGVNSYAAQFVPTDIDNYEIINLGNLSVAVNKADPVITAEQLSNLTTSAINYGQSLSESTITAESVTPGSFNWVNGSKKPTVQEGISNTFEIIFTPNDVDNYNTKIINVKVTVNQTPIVLSDDVKSSVSATAITYEDTLTNSNITGNNPTVNSETITGHYEWKTPTIQPAVSDSETTTYEVIFIPDNNNYANAEMTLTVKVNKKAFTFTTENVNSLTCTDLSYGQSLTESIISGDMPIVGSYRWKDGSIQPTVLGENNYIVEFVPNDTNNYEIVEVGSIHVNVVKSDPIITEEQEANISGSEITYGQSLNDSIITATSTTQGIFAWTDNTIKPNVSDSETTNYEITFTPNDTDNYNTKIFNIKIKVNPLAISELPTETKNSVTPIEITYGDSLEDSIISGDNPIINGVTITGHYEWKNPTIQPRVSDSGTTLYDVVFIPDSDNYAPIELQIPVIINKKAINFNPEEITPTLTIGNLIYGQKLNEATISGTTPIDGTYRWKNGDTITPVANDTTKYTIEFVPNDTDNYEIVDVCEVMIVVNKASANITEEQLNAITVSDITFGQSLSDSIITADSNTPGTFTWEDTTIAPNVAEGASNTYTIIFTPDDTNNYDIMRISVKVKVNPAVPTMPEDIASSISASNIKFGQSLNDAQISYTGNGTIDGTFEWKTPDIKPAMINSDSTEYEVEFIPTDNINYDKITYKVTIHVDKADTPTKYVDFKIETHNKPDDEGTIDFNDILQDIPEWNISENSIQLDDPNGIFKSQPTIVNGILSYELNSTIPNGTIGTIKLIVTSRDYEDITIEIPVVIDKCEHTNVTNNVGRYSSTCTSKGYTGDTVCNDCGTIVKYGTVTNMSPHNRKTVNAESATCTSEGYSGDVYCRDCDVFLEKGHIINKTDHIEGKPVTVVEPTTESIGINDYYCTECGKKLRSEEIPPIVDENNPNEENNSTEENNSNNNNNNSNNDPDNNPDDVNNSNNENSNTPTIPSREQMEANGWNYIKDGVPSDLFVDDENDGNHIYKYWREIESPQDGKPGKYELYCTECGEVFIKSLTNRPDGKHLPPYTGENEIVIMLSIIAMIISFIIIAISKKRLSKLH